MKCFYVYPINDDDADSYWVNGKSEKDARHIVALNVSDASGASDPDTFGCEINSQKQPPQDLIYRRLKGPVTISRR